MIIECHGHCTTAPPALQAWRTRQIAALTDPSAAAPARGDLSIDDELRETIEPDIDPCTSHHFDDTRRHAEAVELPADDLAAIQEHNARAVYPRPDALLKRQGR
ncbi:hypothetical protein [Streptomyces sp. NPDC002962]|uniref:hypothetical protein n=1 Tax=Streptomyces sp. NPDC002962 TaxID=3364674 RepID=UPI00369C6606